MLDKATGPDNIVFPESVIVKDYSAKEDAKKIDFKKQINEYDNTHQTTFGACLLCNNFRNLMEWDTYPSRLLRNASYQRAIRKAWFNRITSFGIAPRGLSLNFLPF